MKKVISLALFASMILTGASTVFAAEQGSGSQAAKPAPAPALDAPKDTSGSSVSSWVNPTWVLDLAKAHPRISTATGVAAALVAMYNYCSWFRKLIGAQEEERAPRLNPRLMDLDSARARAY